ncbi:hypothetical protein CDO44_20970 [Pigmentiphaga sp. NML080357]|uniref:glycosyltransferase family 9 protein n=1 Tax=Pigmentiphaga sp. NML080357 TaxID=2008675 RepID=UPI000B414664|nr:glycosyltransferase family 9 protein [Pigmentiphaga sp. NML080357]OVZ56292.1 hypothetical protein CDO44_20970 [Pigmentiphaga sp. NML080357]
MRGQASTSGTVQTSSIPRENTALLTSLAIGDSLLLMIVAQNLRRHGIAVTVFGPHIHRLRAWFPGFDIREELPGDAAECPAEFRTVIQLHEPGTDAPQRRIVALENLRRLKVPASLAQRLANFSRDSLGLAQADKYNGLVPPPGLVYRKHASRVAIHPMASTPDKRWLASRFVALAVRLKRRGLDPQFIVGPSERPQWEHVQELGIGLPRLGALENVTAWLFESGWFIGNDSGIGHLASNLHVPALSLFMRRGSARTWRPDWGPGRILIGSDGIPMGKLKEKLWKYALTSGRVERAFNQLQSQVSAKQTDLPWDKAQENTARPSGNATRAIMPPARFLPAPADDTES